MRNRRVTLILVVGILAVTYKMVSLNEKVKRSLQETLDLVWKDLDGKGDPSNIYNMTTTLADRLEWDEFSPFERKIIDFMGRDSPDNLTPGAVFSHINIQEHGKSYHRTAREFSTIQNVIQMTPVEAGGWRYYYIQDVQDFLQRVLSHQEKLAWVDVELIWYAREYLGSSTMSVIDLFTLMKWDPIRLPWLDNQWREYDTVQIRYVNSEPKVVFLNSSTGNEVIIEYSNYVLEALFVTFQATIIQMIGVWDGLSLADVYHTFMDEETVVYTNDGRQLRRSDLPDYVKAIWHSYILSKLSSWQQFSAMMSEWGGSWSFPDLETISNLWFTLDEFIPPDGYLGINTWKFPYYGDWPEAKIIRSHATLWENKLWDISWNVQVWTIWWSWEYRWISAPVYNSTEIAIDERDDEKLNAYLETLQQDRDTYLKVMLWFHYTYGVPYSSLEIKNHILHNIWSEERFATATYNKIIDELIDNDIVEESYSKIKELCYGVWETVAIYDDWWWASRRARKLHKDIVWGDKAIPHNQFTYNDIEELVTGYFVMRLREWIWFEESGKALVSEIRWS